MTAIASSLSPVSGAKRTPTIYNVTALLANTEYSQALASNTKAFLIRVRDKATMRVAFASGDTATNYVTVAPCFSYQEDNLQFSGTLYFQTDKANQIIEIVEWT